MVKQRIEFHHAEPVGIRGRQLKITDPKLVGKVTELYGQYLQLCACRANTTSPKMSLSGFTLFLIEVGIATLESDLSKKSGSVLV